MVWLSELRSWITVNLYADSEVRPDSIASQILCRANIASKVQPMRAKIGVSKVFKQIFVQ